MNVVWHRDCFKCTTCSAPLARADTKFFHANGQPFCVQHDPLAPAVVACAACSARIEGEYRVYHDKAFHHQCFKCDSCSVVLGEKFNVNAERTRKFCSACYTKLFIFCCICKTHHEQYRSFEGRMVSQPTSKK